MRTLSANWLYLIFLTHCFKVPKMRVNNDQQQFIDLFRKNHKFLYMIAIRYVSDPDTAKDIVQDFFINYWEKRQESLRGNFEAYAGRSIKNRCISHLRSRQTADNRINQFGSETYGEIDEEEELIDKEALRMMIFKAIDQLPPERKKIILLSAKEGLANKQIAEQLGISIHTVKSQLVKAYAFIRKETQEIDSSSNKNINKSFDDVLPLLILSCLYSIDYNFS